MKQTYFKMNAQKRDLIASRAAYEKAGEVYGCAQCGEALPPVWTGHCSDFCASCEDELYSTPAQEAS